jgi:hypothetical protein
LGLVVIFVLLYIRLGKLIDQYLADPLRAEVKKAVKESEIDTNLKAMGVAEQALGISGKQSSRHR